MHPPRPLAPACTADCHARAAHKDVAKDVGASAPSGAAVYLLEGWIVFCDDVEHAVCHRLLMIRAHCQHGHAPPHSCGNRNRVTHRAKRALRVRCGRAAGALRVRCGCAAGALRVRCGCSARTLRHEPKVQEGHAAIRERQQIPLVRVAMDEPVSHQLHREALDGGTCQAWGTTAARSHDGGYVPCGWRHTSGRARVRNNARQCLEIPATQAALSRARHVSLVMRTLALVHSELARWHAINPFGH